MSQSVCFRDIMVFFEITRYVTDIDECATNNGGCRADARCTNTPGNFTCDCLPGYNGDGFTCTGKLASVYIIDASQVF